MSGKQSLLRFHGHGRGARIRSYCLAGLAAVLLLAACDRPRVGQLTVETDDPLYRRGQKYLSSNKPAALEAFQKVIDKRGGDAPESHFEAGRIYLDHFKDHIAAIYHFRRYRELRPNGSYANHVAQMIETAEKEYLRTRAANPLEAQNDRLDLLEQIKTLQGRVDELRLENDQLRRGGRGGAAALGPPSAATDNPRANQAGAAARAPTVVPAPTPTGGWADALPEETPAPNVVPVMPEPEANTITQAGSGRVYVVQKGDTLVAISRKVYGSASHWKAIYELNKDRLPDPSGLKIGMELRLP